MDCQEILHRIRTAYQSILGDDLVGIYIHGSLAFGCFHRDMSDIDFLAVTQKAPTPAQKQELIKALLTLLPECPPKGLEMSVVLERHCRNFIYPTPYELHFSNSHLERCTRDPEAYCREMHGTDKDLAAHFTVTRAVGFPLCGKPVAEVFGAVPRADYSDSLLYDIADAEKDIFVNPVYVILNLCRVCAFLRDGLILSKEAGGNWGLEHLPRKYSPVIEAAKAAYCSAQSFSADEKLMADFAHTLLTEISSSAMPALR